MADHVNYPNVPKKIDSCPKCSGAMTCDLNLGKSVCWCFSEDPLARVKDDITECMCRTCLRIENAKDNQ